MGDGWDLIRDANDWVIWMGRNGFGSDDYMEIDDEERFPFLIGFCYSSPIPEGHVGGPRPAKPSWRIVDVDAARRLLAAARPGQGDGKEEGKD